MKKNLDPALIKHNLEEIGAFNSSWYLNTYDDVKSSTLDPYYHYIHHGWSEGRLPSPWFNEKIYALFFEKFNYQSCIFENILTHPVEVQRKFLKFIYNYRNIYLEDYFKRINLFNPSWYLAINKDVHDAKIEPFAHYMSYGWKEGRAPSEIFVDSKYNLAIKEILIQDTNPLLNYLKFNDSIKNQFIENIKSTDKAFKKYLMTETRLQKGVCIVGYIKSHVGLGQAAKNIAASMDAVRIPSSYYDISLGHRSANSSFEYKCAPFMDRVSNLMVTDIVSLKEHISLLDRTRINILYPYWELSRIPDYLENSINIFSEIFAPTKFIKDIFENYTNTPITLLPQPVKIPTMVEERNINNPLIIFGFLDFDSAVSRKNPMGIVKTFQRAFKIKDDSAKLVVKVKGSNDKGARALLNELALKDSRITIIDKIMSREMIDSLIKSSDVYLSLHRSEGFGFGAAESLAAGKVVISTDYSGTRDFINTNTGYPIEFKMVPVKEGEYIDWKNQIWAEPDINHAAETLKHIQSNWTEASKRGRAGRIFMKKNYSYDVVGKQLNKLLIDRNII